MAAEVRQVASKASPGGEASEVEGVIMVVVVVVEGLNVVVVEGLRVVEVEVVVVERVWQ